MRAQPNAKSIRWTIAKLVPRHVALAPRSVAIWRASQFEASCWRGNGWPLRGIGLAQMDLFHFHPRGLRSAATSVGPDFETKGPLMARPIVKPSPHIEPDVPPLPEPRGPLPGPSPDILPEPEPGTPSSEPVKPKPGEPMPHNQAGLADPRVLTPGPAGDYEPGGELSKHPATELKIDQSQPSPNPPSEPTPPPRPESVPPQPGRPMEDPMAPKPGPPQPPPPEPPAPPTWGRKRR